MTFGFVKPFNSVVVDDNAGGRKPLIQGLKVESATGMYPGNLVMKRTNDDDIVACSAGGNAIGWLGYGQADPNFKPNDVNSNYIVGDMAPVIYSGGFVIVTTLALSQTIVKGDRLVAGAPGQVVKASPAAITSGAVPVTEVSATPTITRSIGIGGTVVGIAMESITTTGNAADLAVLRSCNKIIYTYFSKS